MVSGFGSSTPPKGFRRIKAEEGEGVVRGKRNLIQLYILQVCRRHAYSPVSDT